MHATDVGENPVERAWLGDITDLTAEFIKLPKQNPV
jgi:hypothetical protein